MLSLGRLAAVAAGTQGCTGRGPKTGELRCRLCPAVWRQACWLLPGLRFLVAELVIVAGWCDASGGAGWGREEGGCWLVR